MQKYIIGSLIIMIGLFLLWFCDKSKEQGINQEVIKQQEQQINIQNEIIEDKKQVTVRKAKAKSVSPNDDLVWLQQNRCTDCNEGK